jgi:serine protease Do
MFALVEPWRVSRDEAVDDLEQSRIRGGRVPRRLTPLWVLAGVSFAVSVCVAPGTTAGSEPPMTLPGGVADLEALQQAFQGVVERVAPSVVGIRAERRQVSALSGARSGEIGGTLEQRVVVNGSGTVIDADGLILTNEHVIQSASEIVVLLYDGSELPATVLKSDPRSDLAILRVDRKGLTPARICDWNDVARGQWTVVIGNPFGLGRDGQLSVAIGIVSNLGRQLPGLGEVDDRFYNDMIQTTAPINPGHSGGPLFNVQGELIGVVTAMHTRAPADEGIGFAIPMTPPKRHVIQALCRGEDVAYGYLGLTVRVPELEERTRSGLDAEHGVVVDRVEPVGPAASAGIRVGDVISAFERQQLEGPAHLADLVGQTPVGAPVRLSVVRDGHPAEISAVIGRRDVSRVSWMRSGSVLWRGMRVADITASVRRIVGTDEGVVYGVMVIEVRENSPADRANVRIGNVIEQVNGQRIDDTTDFLLFSRAKSGPVEVTIRNRGRHTIDP